jgi:hypothetical protein
VDTCGISAYSNTDLHNLERRQGNSCEHINTKIEALRDDVQAVLPYFTFMVVTNCSNGNIIAGQMHASLKNNIKSKAISITGCGVL